MINVPKWAQRKGQAEYTATEPSPYKGSNARIMYVRYVLSEQRGYGQARDESWDVCSLSKVSKVI